jgi:hypothetical protein
MFKQFAESQHAAYLEAVSYYKENPQRLIDAEKFVMDEILHFIDIHLPEIKTDYDEASYLYSFWKNYPPLNRGKAPVGDQYPWLEVGEQVFGNKLQRHFNANFSVKDSGLPSGSDDRCIISSERIRQILGITDSVWVFVDIKSAGPRDDYYNAVMSPYQISGSGNWVKTDDGVKNNPIKAQGKLVSHNFFCSLSPIYVLSDGTVAPLLTFAIKPVYDMLKDEYDKTIGQPLSNIKVASIPNGILLTKNPNYNKKFPGLFIPGKDEKSKNELKMRARVSFSMLKEIADWRVKEVNVKG